MKNKTIKFLIIAIIILIIVLAIGICYLYIKQNKSNLINLGTDIVKDNENAIIVEQKEPETFQGNDRPIAVMIDNSKDAMPHAGLQKAYIIYEMIAEGGESRLMALFKGQSIEKIGPVRSSRHYFLDYAMENDAIYVHYGWSPQAQSDISSFEINNINGVTNDSNYFWRVNDKKAPHNAVISTKNILKAAEDKKYRTTSNISSILKYSVDEIELESMYTNKENVENSNDEESNKLVENETKKNVIDAKEITIPFSTFNNAKWKYDEESKRYERFSKGIQEVDWDTKEAYTAKNIIIEFIKNETLNDGEGKDRQTMSTIGTKDGYYITNGKAIKITCEKTTRRGKTVYKDLNGNEINVNDGNTFIEICPIDAKVKIQSFDEEN